MNITTTAQDFDMSDSIDSFARQQLDAALGRFEGSIISIDVFMKDINGPKGGVDKEVLIRVRLRNRQLIAVDTANRNLYAAIKKGTKRVRRAVRRSLQKSQRVDRLRIRDLNFNADGLAARRA